MFITCVKACTTDVHFSICINGALEGYFNSTSGLRQGCPLSPYLFSIIMDGFSASIDRATYNSNFFGIDIGNCPISHLLFADDLLVFGKATASNAHTLSTILHQFTSVSGLNVNPLKSTILFSSNFSQAAEIYGILHINQSLNPIKYIGLPIHYKKLKNIDFQPLMQKISSFLDGWKAKILCG